MQVPPLEDQLRLSQVPYTIIGGQKFYEKKEIKDLIAYLSVIFNPKDELSLRRILNIPNRGIGTQTLKKYLAVVEEKKIPLFDVIEAECLVDESKKGKNLQDFMAIIKKYNRLFSTMTLTQALGALVNEIDYFDFIDKSYDSPKIASRKRDDVKSFLLSTDRFVDRFGDESTLKNYLERLLLVDNQDNKKEENGVMKNEVQLMTLHASKGLEFDTCFLIGVEEELLPHKNVIRENGDIDEERRLCYVGITRAKRRLIMTYATMRKIYGKEIKRSKSRFIVEHSDYFTEQDRNSFGHLSMEEEENYKSNFFNDLLSSLDD